MRALRQILDNRALLTLAMGHFTNDLFAGVLPMLFPLMKDRFDLDNAQLGLVTLAYAGASSVSQPLFGHIFDRHGKWWFAPATLIWGVCFVAAYGLAWSYPAFLVMAALAGVGSGAWHPLGAVSAAAITEPGARNRALSIYTVGGSVGFAVGPLVAVALLALFGTVGTLALVLPGLLAAALIARQMTAVQDARSLGRAVGTVPVPRPDRAQWLALARVVGVVMLRSWVFLSVIQYLPVWYDDLGYGSGFYGPLVTVIIVAGAVGTLVGGALADRLGQRWIIVGSLTLAIPPLLLFVGFPGPVAIAGGILFGLTADASLSVTLVTAQRLLPGQVGMASGLILGLGFVTGGIGVPITGAIADAVGFQAALLLLPLLLVVAALLALTIPADTPSRLETFHEASDARADAGSRAAAAVRVSGGKS